MKTDYLKIGDVCTVGDGAHASIPRVDIGKMYLTSKNFNKDGIVLNEITYISNEDYKKYFKEDSQALTKPKENDLIFSIIGSLGGVYLYKNDDSFGLSSSVAILRPNRKIVSSSFLSYYMKSDFFQQYVEVVKSGSAQGFLSLKMIRNLPLKIPSNLDNQNKIATLLSNYDNLIQNNTKRIKLLEEMAEEIYKEWFVRLRFPQYEKSKIIDGVPEGWEEKRFLDFGKIVTGKTPLTEKSEYYNGDIPFIKTPDFKQGLFLVNTEETLTVAGAQTQKNQYIEENSICVSCIGTVGEVIIATKKSQTNQQINTINLNNLNFLEYLYFSIKRLKPLILAYASTGATMGNLSKGKFEKIKLLMPHSEIIDKFNEICNPLFEEIKILQQKNQTLKQTRDLLLT